MFYVYVLESAKTQKLYIGFTSNIRRRLKEHTSGNGSAITKTQTDWHIIYFEGYISKEDAIGRERFLKGGAGRKYLKKQLKHYWDRKNLS
jgi:putative endonuclease